MTDAPVSPDAPRIERIGLTVADLEAASAFYEQALGFQRTARETRSGPGFAALMGVEDVRAEAAILRLGAQEIELVQFSPAGRSYPAERRANDPWFQHFAIVVGDMDAAYERLTAVGGSTAISTGGPQRLPPATGSIIAYKFRDPEGHPLELSWFPPALAGPTWRDPPAGAVFLGVDHSAIAVSDAEAGARFYIDGLGWRQAAQQVNTGPTQERLDGLAEAEVEIVSLEPGVGGPHLELLAYRRPQTGAAAVDLAPQDLAATRLILGSSAIEPLLVRLQAAGGRQVSKGVVTLEDGSRAALIRDADGHLLELRERG